MIKEEEYLQTVSKTNVDFTPFIEVAINEVAFRDILIKQPLENKSITFTIIHI